MIDTRRLELRHLRYFSLVADELHFGRAAVRLALSPPALSVQIRQLEEIVGATLFDRHSRRVVLTDAGRVLKDAAARLLRDVDAALAAARRADQGHAGLLRVGVAPTLMLSSLGSAVRTYRARYPGVQLELREMAAAEQVAGLLGGDLDVGVGRGVAPDPRLHVGVFALEPLLIALHRGHPLARATRVPVKALAREPWVLFPRTIAPLLHEQVMRLCAEAGFSPHVVQESREVYTTVGLVGAGVGVTIVPATVGRMAWPGVIYKPVPKATVQLSLVRLAGPVRPVVDAFRAVVAAAAGPRPPQAPRRRRGGRPGGR